MNNPHRDEMPGTQPTSQSELKKSSCHQILLHFWENYELDEESPQTFGEKIKLGTKRDKKNLQQPAEEGTVPSNKHSPHNL